MIIITHALKPTITTDIVNEAMIHLINLLKDRSVESVTVDTVTIDDTTEYFGKYADDMDNLVLISLLVLLLQDTPKEVIEKTLNNLNYAGIDIPEFIKDIASRLGNISGGLAMIMYEGGTPEKELKKMTSEDIINYTITNL